MSQTVKTSACNAGDPGLIPGSGRFPGEGNGNPLQYSCLENSMDGGAWQATVHGATESDTTEQLHFLSFIPTEQKSWVMAKQVPQQDEEQHGQKCLAKGSDICKEKRPWL